MKHGSLFSGIGGFDLAAEWMGWENVFHCEWNIFGQKVLSHYWPKAETFTDITKSDFTKYHGTIDIISGGFPCQPYSQAGKRKGKQDERHLWPEMLRAIREIQPRWIVGENVYGIINWSRGMVVNEIKTDLESAGYTLFTPIIIPACGKNAPHQRDRIWFIIEREVQERRPSQQFNRNFIPDLWDRRSFTRSCFADDGVSEGLDTTSISKRKWEESSVKAAGNAIVPQVAFEIFKAIEKYNRIQNVQVSDTTKT
jgi:DNA-cytosine methyltransferase